MSTKEILQKVKALIFEEDMPESVVADIPKYVLADGTVLKITSLEVGGVATLESGEPAPAGEHTLADGVVITVGEAGVLTSVTMPTPTEEVEVESGKDKDKEEYAAKFAALESEIADLKANNSKLAEGFARHQQIIEQMFELVQAIAKVPDTEPTTKPDGFKASAATTKQERVLRFANHISSIIKNK